jgi:hypothetical protein
MQGLEDLASCSGRWRGAAVYASLFLGYTDCCGSIQSMRWGQEAIFLPYLPPHTAATAIIIPMLLRNENGS